MRKEKDVRQDNRGLWALDGYEATHACAFFPFCFLRSSLIALEVLAVRMAEDTRQKQKMLLLGIESTVAPWLGVRYCKPR